MNDQQFELLLSSILEVKTTVNTLDNKIDSLSIETGKQEIRIGNLEGTLKGYKNFIYSSVLAIFGAVVTTLVLPSFQHNSRSSHRFIRQKPPIIRVAVIEQAKRVV